MTRGQTLGLLLGALTLGSRSSVGDARACTIFFAFDGKLALAGNSEDWTDPITFMWVRPGGPSASATSAPSSQLSRSSLGRIIFGFGNGFPQGGVNERGLFFDGAATFHEKRENVTGKPLAPFDVLDRMLAECADVKQALAYLEQYHVPWTSQAMMLLADRSGRSVIWEGNHTLERPADVQYQVLTNFRQSQAAAEQALCFRKIEADRQLSAWAHSNAPLTVEPLLSVLQAVQAPTTRYSQVFDLTAGVIHLYVERDFQHPIRLDVSDQLQRGPRTARLSELTAAGEPGSRPAP